MTSLLPLGTMKKTHEHHRNHQAIVITAQPSVRTSPVPPKTVDGNGISSNNNVDFEVPNDAPIARIS